MKQFIIHVVCMLFFLMGSGSINGQTQKNKAEGKAKVKTPRPEMIKLLKPVWFDYHVESLRRASKKKND